MSLAWKNVTTVIIASLLFLIAAFVSNLNASARTAKPEEVTFPSGNLLLHGFIYKPQGNGPFPAILYNHGSEQNPSWKPALGEFFSSRGYVFFVPHRRGHGRSLHDFFVKSLRAQGAGEPSRCTRHISQISWQLSLILSNCLTLTLIGSL